VFHDLPQFMLPIESYAIGWRVWVLVAIMRTDAGSTQDGWLSYRFAPTRLRHSGSGYANKSVHLSEIVFRHKGQRIDMQFARATVAQGNSSLGQGPYQAIDGHTQSDWIEFGMRPIIITFPISTPIDSYTFFTAGGTPYNDPVRWRLEGSKDGGVSYQVLHQTLQHYPTPYERRMRLEWFRIPQCFLTTGRDTRQECIDASLLVQQGLAHISL